MVIPDWLNPDVARAGAYSISHTPYGMIIWGSVPLQEMSVLLNNYHDEFPDCLVDFGLPSYYKCTMVVVRDHECHDKWHAEVDKILDSEYENDQEARWLHGLDTGLSSLCIFHHMKQGILQEGQEVHIPHDHDDFGRCYRLLEIKPAWRKRMSEMGENYPEWKPFFDHWNELEADYVAGRFKQVDERIKQITGENA